VPFTKNGFGLFLEFFLKYLLCNIFIIKFN
jgi:hypothetical protein